MQVIQRVTFYVEEQFSESAKAAIRRRLPASVKEASLKTLADIRPRIPIDTGRARNSWGTDVWEERDGGLEIEQGSEVVYFQRLNEGYSQQAPAGFVDAQFERSSDVLFLDIVQIVNEEA
jgi:hypothetical protein